MNSIVALQRPAIKAGPLHGVKEVAVLFLQPLAGRRKLQDKLPISYCEEYGTMIHWNRGSATHIPLSYPASYLPLQFVVFLLLQVTLHSSHGSLSFKSFSTHLLKEQVWNHIHTPSLSIKKKRVQQIALAINKINPFV